MASATTVKLASGHTMPLLGLGTWQSKAGEVETAVKYALKAGYRHIDCAACYGNETEVGAAIRAAIEEYGIKRSVNTAFVPNLNLRSQS